jgi:hypothetical protein
MLRWDWYGYHKKRVKTHYAELVFLHLLGSAGHAVHFGGSGAQNVDAHYLMLRWARYGNHRKHVGTRYAKLVILHSVGSAGHVLHSGMSGL